MSSNNAKNELLQFLGGVLMLAVGLFIFSNKVIVTSGFFGSGISLWGFRMNTGLVIVPLIIGIVWMFVSGGSFASKLFTTIAVLFIVAVIIMNTNIRLVTMSLYDWVIILVLIFGGGALVAKVLFAYKGEDEEGGRRSKRGKKNSSNDDTYDPVASIDDQIEQMRKNMK